MNKPHSRQEIYLINLFEQLHPVDRDELMALSVKERMESLIEADSHLLDSRIGYLERCMEGDLTNKDVIRNVNYAMNELHHAIMLNRTILFNSLSKNLLKE